MNILVICQYYNPEPLRVTDVCEELVKMGHNVTVVTGTPNYPMGEIYPGYENGKRMDETVNGVHIHRCITAPRKTGTINRVRNYYSYPRASKKYVKTLQDNFDVVFVYQISPVMMAGAGILYQKKYHKRLVLYCLDLWPESLCVGGIKKGSVIYRIFARVSKRIYCSADSILVSSKMFRGYLTDRFGIKDETIEYLPQYAEAQFLSLQKKQQEDMFHLLFAGNIGTAQNMDTIIDAAIILKNENIRFHIVGDGIELAHLQEKAAGLKNVSFYGKKPLEEMPYYYAMANAMLITLTDDPVISLTLPSKVQTYMAAGRPIVGAINGETALVLAEAQGGYCGKAGDAEELASNIIKLKESGKAAEIGEKNREYYLKEFSKEKSMEKLAANLENNVR